MWVETLTYLCAGIANPAKSLGSEIVDSFLCGLSLKFGVGARSRREDGGKKRGENNERFELHGG